jgi:hypothetical protein
MLTQAADSLSRWPAPAIHDTVAAIVRQDDFQRRLARSFAERFLAWLWERLGALFDAIAGTPGARTAALFFTGALLVALLLRIVLASRNARFAARVVRAVGPYGIRSLPTLEDARRLARDARYADATHVLYGAILEALSQQRLIRLHASKTSGDFARELRGRGHPSYDPFRVFVRRFDRLLYGRDACDAASFDALWGDAQRVMQASSAAGVQ